LSPLFLNIFLEVTTTAELVQDLNAKSGVAVPQTSIAELEAYIGFTFNAALIDCEACIDAIFPGKENDPFLKQLEVVYGGQMQPPSTLTAEQTGKLDSIVFRSRNHPGQPTNMVIAYNEKDELVR
jgi:hypothetical protein